MLAKRIIPCLDVHAGRVVKGVNFVNLQDAGDPVEIAQKYEQQGADELVFLDIAASHEERDIILDVVSRTSEVIFMPLTVGGGIRTVDDIRRLLNAGCDKVSINSAAVKTPEFVKEAALKFGSQCIVVNIDPKRVQKDGEGVLGRSHQWRPASHGTSGCRMGSGSGTSGRRGNRAHVHGCRRDQRWLRSGNHASCRGRGFHPGCRQRRCRIAGSSCVMQSPKVVPVPHWRPASFTTANTQSKKPNVLWLIAE